MKVFMFVMWLVWMFYTGYDIINKDYNNLYWDIPFVIILFIVLIFITRDTREDKILKSCGNVCFCSNCHEPLNDNSSCETLCDSGIYKYICTKCSTETVFHFGIAPCPIWLKDYGKDKLSIDSYFEKELK